LKQIARQARVAGEAYVRFIRRAILKIKFTVVPAMIILFLLACMNSCVSIKENDKAYVGKYIEIQGYFGDRNLEEFLEYVDSRAQAIIEKYNPGYVKPVVFRLYSTVDAFHNAGFGRKGNDGSVGTGQNGKVYMVNPYCSKVHDYDEMLIIGVHEFTHVVTLDINSSMPIWLSEGIAMLEAGQANRYSELKREALRGELPKYNALQYDDNSVYKYSRSIAEFIIDTYSIEAMRDLIKTPDIKKVLHLTNDEFQNEWSNYLKARKI